MDKYILGIDGGGTNTTCYLFNNKGQTIEHLTSQGTNLFIYKEIAVKRLIDLINRISKKSKINLSEISAFGFGLSGVSDIHHRELLLKELDKLNLSSNSLIISDAEIAFNLLCPTGVGLLVSVGTGIICVGKNSFGQTFRVAGEGFEKDIGSGYWIGKKIIDNIIVNSGIANIDYDLKEIFNIIKKIYNIDKIDSFVDIFNDTNAISLIASLTKSIIILAEKGNDVALSVIQEATRNVSEYILALSHDINLNSKEIIISGNGSILKNKFYRKLLNQSLEFDFKKIHWVFSDVSPAYSAGIMAAAANNINVSIDAILKKIKN